MAIVIVEKTLAYFFDFMRLDLNCLSLNHKKCIYPRDFFLLLKAFQERT